MNLMVSQTIVASSSLFSIQSPSLFPAAKTSYSNGRCLIAKPNSSSMAVPVKAIALDVPRINGNKINNDDAEKTDEDGPSYALETFRNQSPDWTILLAAILLAAANHPMPPDRKLRELDMIADTSAPEKIMQDGPVFKQKFVIRSYEIGADRRATIETLMNQLQETAIGHLRSAGILSHGFGPKPDLIWVVAKMQVHVERYPSWDDTVQVDTWTAASGNTGMRRDWHVCDYKTGDTIMRATSFWLLMNKCTRRLSRIPEEVRAKIETNFSENVVIAYEDRRILSKLNDDTADYIKSGISPRWSDLDLNQHVNNVKFIDRILEGTPMWIFESHELTGMTVEYRKECGGDNVLESLTALSTNHTSGSSEIEIECEHQLRLECGAEVVRGRTVWKPKCPQGLDNKAIIPTTRI